MKICLYVKDRAFAAAIASALTPGTYELVDDTFDAELVVFDNSRAVVVFDPGVQYLFVPRDGVKRPDHLAHYVTTVSTEDLVTEINNRLPVSAS
jgi:hypothetical protein